VTYEHIDTKLVNALIGNGRASLRSLAEELDVSVTTVSNHLSDLEDRGVITGYSPIVEYGELEFDVTAILRLKVEGSALPDLTERLQGHRQMVSVYEVTGEFDIIGIGKFENTDDMNATIKELLADADINESSTAVVLNTPAENEQFEIETE
jgi:DNA-binding Lrp family transcriptional regulator